MEDVEAPKERFEILWLVSLWVHGVEAKCRGHGGDAQLCVGYLLGSSCFTLQTAALVSPCNIVSMRIVGASSAAIWTE